jgi:hypothetical protein
MTPDWTGTFTPYVMGREPHAVFRDLRSTLHAPRSTLHATTLQRPPLAPVEIPFCVFCACPPSCPPKPRCEGGSFLSAEGGSTFEWPDGRTLSRSVWSAVTCHRFEIANHKSKFENHPAPLCFLSRQKSAFFVDFHYSKPPFSAQPSFFVALSTSLPTTYTL